MQKTPALTIELHYPTPPAWTRTVLENFNAFLVDHAACERKASSLALSLVAHYPDKPELVRVMTDLAVEELSHFREVMKWIYQRGLQLGPDVKDSYVNQLRQQFRTPREDYFLDRLLIAGIIEARGHERFALIAEALPSGTLQKFYAAITQSEQRHSTLFLDLCRHYVDQTTLAKRLNELLTFEATVIQYLPIRAALH